MVFLTNAGSAAAYSASRALLDLISPTNAPYTFLRSVTKVCNNWPGKNVPEYPVDSLSTASPGLHSLGSGHLSLPG